MRTLEFEERELWEELSDKFSEAGANYAFAGAGKQFLDDVFTGVFMELVEVTEQSLGITPLLAVVQLMEWEFDAPTFKQTAGALLLAECA